MKWTYNLLLVIYVVPLLFCLLLDLREEEKPMKANYIPLLNAYLMGFVIYHQLRERLILLISYVLNRFCFHMARYHLRNKNLYKTVKWIKINHRNYRRLEDFGARQRERFK